MAAITSAVISGATAGYSIFNGERQKKEAKKALNALEVPVLENVYEDLPISTQGSDLLREENGRTTASLIEASRNAGSRGVYSAIPRIQAQNNEQNKEAQLYIDNQIQKRNSLIAQDERRIQGINEGRYNAELEGIGQLQAAGEQNTFNGIRGLANTAISAANNISFGETPKLERVDAPTSSITPIRSNPIPRIDISGLESYQKAKADKDILNSGTDNYGF